MNNPTALTLASDQVDALDNFKAFMADANSKSFALTGTAGTGKTTMLRAILSYLEQFFKLRANMVNDRITHDVHISATTNPAVEILNVSLNSTDVRTIYSLMGLKVRTDLYTGSTTIKNDESNIPDLRGVIIIDEGSYITPELMSYIDRYLTHCKIMYVGDAEQTVLIPGFKTPLETADYISELVIPKRTDPTSGIYKLSQAFKSAVRTLNFPSIATTLDNQVVCMQRDDYLKELEATISSGRTDFRVVAWTNKCVEQYSAYIRKMQGFADPLSPGESFTVKDRISLNVHFKEAPALIPGYIYHTDNVFHHRNANIPGCVVFTTTQSTHKYLIINDHKAYKAHTDKLIADANWKEFYKLKSSVANVRSLLTSTVHKAQGCTVDTVFIDALDINRCSDPELKARLMYTAISRARKQVIILIP